MLHRALAIAANTVVWLVLMALADPRFALASHWIAGRKSWEFPWYAVAMMMVIPYIILGLVGLAVYRAIRSRSV